MILISIKNIKKSYGDIEILKDVSLDIKSHEVIGLVGNNGAGKTTLANILYGIMPFDQGTIETYKENITFGYMRQSTETFNHSLSNQLNQKGNDISIYFETTSQLGLRQVKSWSNEKMNHLSGGEKTKLALSEVFSEYHDVLILDEPTNHLDYKGIEWLIEEIKRFLGAVIVISHDRYFLDQVCQVIAEIENGVIQIYQGNYTFYRNEKQRNYDILLHQYEEQQKREKHIDEEINRLKKWSYIAHRDSNKHETPKEYWRKKAKKKDVQIKSAIKRLEKMREEGVSRPKEEKNVLFEFVSENKRGKSIILSENLTKSYDDKILFKNSDFYISRGEKVGIIGENGCGKTTLIKMILNENTSDSGKLWVSPSAKIAYLSQDVMDLDDDVSISLMIKSYDKEKKTKARTLFASIGINERMINRPIKSLSLGERTRVKLVFLILEENDVLILDEPTNHLDLHSREQLEKTLENYTGTMLIASHDRYLLEKITNKLLVFENQNVSRYEVGYKEYKEQELSKKQNNKEYDLMVIQNQITYVLSEINKYKPTDEMYKKLDVQFNELINKKKEMMMSS